MFLNLYQNSFLLIIFYIYSFTLSTQSVSAGELWIGTSSISITPDEPVAISGQFRTRIATKVESPVTATALALETRNGEKIQDQAIMISCELVSIREDIQKRFRQRVKPHLPGFDINKIFLSATHTHTAPVMIEGKYQIPKKGVMQPADYVELLINRLVEVATNAWKLREQGGVSWGMGHAIVAYNRRTLYANGTARMYGPTNTDTFRGIEGYEDHGVEVLFFWNRQNKLLATAVNVACPAQEVESGNAVNADYWHDVRLQLRKKYGQQLQVVGWIGAAGDQSPHLRFRKQAEDRMRQKRKLSRLKKLPGVSRAQWKTRMRSLKMT